MKILLIGNFAPPFEEESLQNISLFTMLQADGNDCTAINISANPCRDSRFIDSNSNFDYLMKLIRHSRNKDIIHFSTKGYLRVGLLKMMMSVFVCKISGIKSVISFHSELFSMLGQMRSPFGGTQTLNTSFYLADKITFSDSDTYNVATMYQKRQNYELLPAFIYIPDHINKNNIINKLKPWDKVIFLSVTHRVSFIYETLREITLESPPPSNTAIVVSMPAEHEKELRSLLGPENPLFERLFFIDPDDEESSMAISSRADLILRPLSCDGETFFEEFTLIMKKTEQFKDSVAFPESLLLLKEGDVSNTTGSIISSLLSTTKRSHDRHPSNGPSYPKLKEIYGL